jgi:ribosome-associated protein
MKAPKERRTTIAKKPLSKPSLPNLERLILKSLDQQKAEAIVTVDISGKSDFADRMVIASGTSQRHVGALAARIVETLKAAGFNNVPVEGEDVCDWVLVDAGNIVVHIFRPEARRYYNLEKMWSVAVPQQSQSQLEAAY